MTNEQHKLQVHDLLERVVEEEFPGRKDLLPDIMARARLLQPAPPAGACQVDPGRPAGGAAYERRSRLRPLATGLVSIAVVAGLLAYAFFGSALLDNPPTVTAAEIVARVEESAGDPRAFGLRNFHGVYQQTFAPGSADSQRNHTQEIWFQEPDKLRAETRSLDPGLAGRMTIFIVAEGRLWEFSPGSNRGVIHESVDVSQTFTYGAREEFIALWERMRLGDMADELGAILNLVGEETILGRPAYVLESITSKGLGQRTRLWVDKEYYLMLRHEVSRERDGALLLASGFTSLAINGVVDAQLFVPPADVSFEAPARKYQLPSLADVAGAPFALFDPQVMPGTGKDDQITMMTDLHLDQQPPALIATYLLVGETTTMESEGERSVSAEFKHLFRMTITPATGDAVCSADEVALGGVEVVMGEQRGCSYTSPDSNQGKTVALTRDGSRIVLNADEWSLFTMEQLVQVASSLAPVKR